MDGSWIMDPLQLALRHAEELINRNQWVKIYKDIYGTPELVLIYGQIHTDGTREKAIATRTYDRDKVTTQVHS